ncbi:hypothetical protein QAD02_017966 [Eretmocerus hayati]|uniref:Uncharacterized protein n=1 Tax=Eretmocerus hayati TaxID=131215 RepID=A0ACC2PHW4_9HYME|nr:hypothetical protein QAD02_017966 [Eretmocerus hayati]
MYSIYNCTVPDCGQSTTNKSLTFHKFPKNEDLRSRWVEKCRITKKLSERSYVCSSHFDARDYMTSSGPRKPLEEYAVPSVFPEKSTNQAEDAGNVADDAVPYCVQESATRSKFLPSILRKRVKLDSPAQSMSADQEAGSRPSLVREEPPLISQDLQECDMGSRVQGFTIASAYVGDKDSSDDPGPSFGLDEAVEELESAVAEIEMEGNGTITEEEIDIVREKDRKFHENREKDRLTLLDLIRNDEDLVASTGINTELFDNLCAVVSKCEGEAYQEKFATSVRGRIVMCLWCETVKLLRRMDPSGVITYLSPAYGGQISDKETFKQNGLSGKLDPTLDAIMVDIELECLASHTQLIIPPKLSKKTRFTFEGSIQTNEIAAARVHVEKVIQRMKLWEILKDKITLTTVTYIDDIVKVIFALVNLKNPPLADDKF